MGSRAHTLGNDMLSFLRSKAALVKLRRGKFTLKADVLVEGMLCTLKLRVYKVSEQSLAVEMQRRAGDVVTFAVVFGMLVQHLKQCGQPMQDACNQYSKLTIQVCVG